MRALFVIVLLTACAAPPDSTGADAAEGADAGAIADAGDHADAGDADAGDDADAGNDADAGEVADAGPSACTAEGRAGTCVPLAECDTGYTRPEGCTGHARVQCCLEARPETHRCPETRTPDVNAGMTTEPPGLGGCPSGMARVDAFCMDRWEASLVVDDEQRAAWSPYRAPEGALRAVSVPDAYPQAYVTQLEAASACARAGKRLCTDVEWQRACRGAEERSQPYGTQRVAGRCHDETGRTIHPAIACFGLEAQNVFSQLDDPGIDQEPDALAPAGSYAGCVTPESVFDLVGNLHEWTADPAGTFRGGFFADTQLNGVGCAYRTTAHDTAYSDYSTGFRCCADLVE